MGSATLNVKGAKEKGFDKRTLCLPCYANSAGEVNAKAVSRLTVASGSRGLARYVQPLESGHCDKCRQNF